ncbi:MAG: HNH endonuclease [Brevundimonas sp.]
MSLMLGRPLRSDENVHHKNGDRGDNRPSNLELWVKPQPAGQRVEDVIAWAKDILKRYRKFDTSTAKDSPQLELIIGGKAVAGTE